MKFKLALFAFLALSFQSCKDEDPQKKCGDEKSCSSLVFVRDGDVSTEGTIRIISAKAEDENIKLRIGISGCDQNRNFQLQVGTSVMRSLPPQRFAWITATSQMCEAYFETELCVDRKALPDACVLHLVTAHDTTRLLIPDLD